MSTAWFSRTSGQFPSGVPRAVEVETDDGPAVLVGDLSVPSRVRIPPELGGGERRVRGSFREACPKHDRARWGEGSEVLVLDLGEDLLVAECPRCGFIFFSLGAQP